ncbi:hypothetical protein [Streptosporangium sp. NPDC006007]|uniref:McrC family protein n=1 Tax=Streptosporangium sp. NPDC006007 TaxID=3154575 RepID=UPI0033B62B2F
MIPVPLKEGSSEGATAEFSAETAKILKDRKIASVTPLGGGRYALRALLKVGAVRFPDLELHIQPKLTISRLWFLLGFAYKGVESGWQEPEVSANEHPGLLPGVAHAFLRATGKALPHGLPHGYRQESRALPVVRGRIREADQVRRQYGRLLPAEVTYHTFSVDTPETRLLRAATERLLQLPGVHPTVQVRLRELLPPLRRAASIPAGTIPAWRPSPANAHYRTALGLADLVLRGGSFEFHDDSGRAPLAVDGLLVGMDKVFEDFLEHALGGLLTRHGGVCEAQEREIHLDVERSWAMKPDIRWHEAGRTHAIIDAKYSGAKGEPEHRYQMVTYCAKFHSPQGHIVYAGGGRKPMIRRRILSPRMELFNHRLDLASPIEEIRVQLEDIAQQIITVAHAARTRNRARTFRFGPP